ncbi:MAG: DUF4397 domain-containing protein, partial [Bacteroidales bacterium]|nr:DUF4397 domain-containing protein [Bacteroidales bacterium]
DMGQLEASEAGNTDVMVFHGSTDAPTVDVAEPFEQLTLVDNLSYGSFTGEYLNLATSDYQLQIQDEFGSKAVAQFGAPLETLGLEDSALVVVASGFLDSTVNNNGPAFGLYAALPSGGEMVELPAGDVSQAMVQVIHNSADAAASTVDVWLNDEPLLDDFAFRTASPFVPLTAGTNLDVSIQPSSSTDTVDALAKFSYQLLPDEKYVLMASGLVSSSGYDPVEPFDIDVFQGARTEASQGGNTDVLVYHGATDAPIVDIYESSVPAGTLVDNLAYGAYSEDYLELSTDNYVLDVQDESGSTTVAQYEANLSDLGLADSALVTLASGFLEPGNNSDGPAFGLFVALPSGGDLVELPEYEAPTALDDRLSELTRMRIYPNPVSSELIIDVHNDARSPVTVELYNVMGQKMPTPFDKRQLKGHHVLRYDVSSLAEGLYFVILSDGDSRMTRKIKVIK